MMLVLRRRRATIALLALASMLVVLGLAATHGDAHAGEEAAAAAAHCAMCAVVDAPAAYAGPIEIGHVAAPCEARLPRNATARSEARTPRSAPPRGPPARV